MGNSERPTNLTPGLYRFDEFYWHRIYGPNGYYKTGNGVGIDIETYVSLEPALAPRIGIWLDEEWARLGRPALFPVYEIGAGDGSLAKKLLGLELKCADAIQYTAVESNQIYQNYFQSSVIFQEVLNPAPNFGVIIGNEVLDQQPPRFVSFIREQWHELYIRVGTNPSYEWLEMTDTPPATVRAIQGLSGSAPWISEAAELMRSLTQNLTGSVLMLDYGFRRTADFPGKPWFRCWHRFKEVPVLDFSILPDMSTPIPVDQLSELFYEAKVCEQATWIAGEERPHDGFYVMEWKFIDGRPIDA